MQVRGNPDVIGLKWGWYRVGVLGVTNPERLFRALVARNPENPYPVPSSAALGPAREPLHRVLEQLAVGRQAEFMFDGLAVGFDGLDRQREFLGDLA